jgi:3-hydroxyisobutyrate dehydrogenase
MTQQMRVAVIGLGAMGLPMGSRLSSGEFTVSGFDPWRARRDLAAASGMRTHETPGAAAAGADVVLLAVRDGSQAESALFGTDGVASTMPRGSTIVLTSTIGADVADAIAERVARDGGVMVDAPVSGGPVRAGDGDLLIVVGAPADDIARVRPMLDRLASTLHVVGSRVGDGQLLKVINQLLAGVHIAAAAEAIALARNAGLDPSLVVDVLTAGAAGSFMLGDRGPRMVEAFSGDPEVKSRVDIFVKDMGLVTALARDLHVATPVASAAQQLYALTENAGLGADDDSVVVRLLGPGPKENQ